MESDLPIHLSIEPMFGVVTGADSVNQIIVGIQFCISLPQSVLPEPVDT